MALLGLDSKVNHNGTITTIRQLAESGTVRFNKTDNWYHKTKGTVTAYFADTGPDKGYQIARFTYEAAIVKWPHLAGKWEESVTAYKITTLEDGLRAKLPARLHWLLDVDYFNWQNAYKWLMTASESDIIAHAERVQSPTWDETQEPYYVPSF
jgi:hypothetical protein